jgi:hypothetical protein
VNDERTCESCGAATTHHDFMYDRTSEGMGRCRFISLCDDCVDDYLKACWGLTTSTEPQRAFARELGGKREAA